MLELTIAAVFSLMMVFYCRERFDALGVLFWLCVAAVLSVSLLFVTLF